MPSAASLADRFPAAGNAGQPVWLRCTVDVELLQLLLELKKLPFGFDGSFEHRGSGRKLSTQFEGDL